MKISEHPIVLTATAVAATLGLCFVGVKEIVLPTQVAAISYESNVKIEKLTKQRDELQEQLLIFKSSAEVTEKQLEWSKSKVASLSEELFTAQLVSFL